MEGCAHALRARLSADLLAVFETGVLCQLLHALALVLVGVLIGRQPARLTAAAGWHRSSSASSRLTRGFT